MDYVECRYEAQRRQYQNLALIAYKNAEWVNRILGGKGKTIRLTDELPYWNTGEKDEARAAELKERLMRNARYGNS